jgi:hypothetical protein
MNGTYRVYSGGKLIAEKHNLITTLGRSYLIRCIAEQRAIGQSISVGIGDAPPLVTDTELQFESSKAAVGLISPDLIDQKIVVKATLDQQFAGEIRELGLWSLAENLMSGEYPSKLLTEFDSETEQWPDEAVFSTSNTRMGADSLQLTAPASSSSSIRLDGIYLDLLGYSNNDTLKFAYNVQDANTSSIDVRFITTEGNYYEYTISAPSAGYHIDAMLKGAATATGTPTWSVISAIELQLGAGAGGEAVVNFDGIRIEDSDTPNPEHVLVSRSVLDTPITKHPYEPMDIEYTLDIGVS